MNVSMQKIVNAVNMYIERDAMNVAVKMQGVDQFLYGFKLGLIKERASAYITNILSGEGAKMAGITNEEGHVDIDALYNAAKYSISKMSEKKIKVLGFVLDEADIDKLYNYARS